MAAESTTTPKPRNVAQWKPGASIPGVIEETKVAKSGDPEVTHGLMLIPGCQPINLPAKANVGDTISAGRAHVALGDGSDELVLPGDWVVTDASGKVTAVLTDAEAREVYDLG